SRSSVRAAESLLSGRIQVRRYRGRVEMSRKSYNRLSFMAVSWLDEFTLATPLLSLNAPAKSSIVGVSLAAQKPGKATPATRRRHARKRRVAQSKREATSSQQR